MEFGICIVCGKRFVKTPRRKYCSHRCNSIFNSRKRYELLKNTEEYKEKAYHNTKRWVRNNRERFNKLCLNAYYRRKELEQGLPI